VAAQAAGLRMSVMVLLDSAALTAAATLEERGRAEPNAAGLLSRCA